MVLTWTNLNYKQLWSGYLVNAVGKSFPKPTNGMFATNAATASVHIACLIIEVNTAAAASNAANAPLGIWKNDNADWIVFSRIVWNPITTQTKNANARLLWAPCRTWGCWKCPKKKKRKPPPTKSRPQAKPKSLPAFREVNPIGRNPTEYRSVSPESYLSLTNLTLRPLHLSVVMEW